MNYHSVANENPIEGKMVSSPFCIIRISIYYYAHRKQGTRRDLAIATANSDTGLAYDKSTWRIK